MLVSSAIRAVNRSSNQTTVNTCVRTIHNYQFGQLQVCNTLLCNVEWSQMHKYSFCNRFNNTDTETATILFNQTFCYLEPELQRGLLTCTAFSPQKCKRILANIYRPNRMQSMQRALF